MLLRAETWSTDLRYQVGLVETEEAEAFLDAAVQILHWIQRSLS